MSKPSITLPWIEQLRAECEKTSQAVVAKQMGYAASVISQVLKGTYRGNPAQVRLAFTEHYGGLSVQCPVMGEMPTQSCRRFRTELHIRTSNMRAQFAQACPKCAQNPDLKTQQGEVK